MVRAHRDTLGSVQEIGPGDVNWMTAGRGIAHFQRTPEPLRESGQPMLDLQTWAALPISGEEVAPAFHHHPVATLPCLMQTGALLRVVAGRAYGVESPAHVFTDTLYVAIDLEPDAEVALDATYRGRALYVLQGEAQLDGADLPAMHLLLLLLEDGVRHRLRAKTPIKAMMMGGEPLDGPRHLWWNFVSSSKARIEQAKQDWRERRFGTIDGDAEFIPLPQK